MSRTNKPGYAPGEYAQTLGSYFVATILGGSFGERGVWQADFLYRDTLSCVDGQDFLHLRIRLSDQTVVEPTTLEMWCESYAKDHTYDESEAYARRLARAWHAETYVFDHWVDNGRFKRKSAVYRFVGASSLVPFSGTRSWGVGVGKSVALPCAPSHLPVARDVWNDLVAEVDDTCAAFHRIAALMPPDSVEDQLAGPRVAVEHCRAEAHRLAAIGHQLDELPRDASIEESRAAIETQLVSTRNAALQAVSMVSTLGITASQVFVDDARLNGERDLAALSGAIGELAETNALGALPNLQS